MTDVVVIGATFATVEAASMALRRLRRHQARRVGTLRIAPLGAAGRVVNEVLVAGPVFAEALPDVRRTIDELGGRVVAIVRSVPQVRRA